MGILTTRWEATFEGHNVTVSRNEVLRGFTLEWDGRELARRTWSWVGLGELHGSAEADGKHHEVHVKLSLGSGPGEGVFTDGRCDITVDGQPLDVRHVR